MRIRRKFLQLTSWTYPYGTEYTLESYLPKGFQRDENENYYIVVGNNPSTMFTCHLDTACSYQEKVTHVPSGNFIRTNGKTILGSDDKAGMTVMLYMIEKKVPGIYYFFTGEEVGCIGSGDLADQWFELKMFNDITKIVSFDRRGTGSVITHQLYGRCCSNEFAEELSKRLNDTDEGINMSPDNTGIMTDSAKFVDMVPECTNISVGYYKEHTVDECQDIEFLQRLCKAVVKIDWETLPVKRDPTEEEEESYIDTYANWSNGKYKYSIDEDGYEFLEENYTYVQYSTPTGKDVKKMLISKDRVSEEKKYIYNWVFSTGLYSDMTGMDWNGHSLYIANAKGNLEFVGNRVELMDYVPELKTVPTRCLSDKPRKHVKDIDTEVTDMSDDRFMEEYMY